MADDSPTIVDAPRPRDAASRTRPGSSRPPTPLSRAGGESTTVDLPRPETVLLRAEIEQTRKLAISGVLFNLLGLVAAPFFGGDPTARLLFILGLAWGELNNLWLLYVASDDRRYHERKLMAYFLLATVPNAAVIYYLGVFGPILAMFVLNLYASCLGFSQRVARLTLICSIAPILTLGGLIVFDVIPDPGLITVTDAMGVRGSALVIVAFSLFLFLTYGQARRAHEVMVASLTERDAAVRLASHREALFLEARYDLECALQAGGFGRFSDQTLGSYKLGAVLGRGGMGEVYSATHVDSGEPAAVKMLLPEVLGKPEYVRRFLREVRIAASLESDHVVRVLEVGDESAALPYLAMELLEGEDLAQILRRDGRLEPAAVVDLVRQVGDGLSAAAAAGIVHRDLKPQNLFLTAGASPTWKILDFGVSKLLKGSGTLTRGEAVGTPSYMAPEQASGGVVDARADLYALGAIAYRALTGHQPFTGNEAAVVLVAVLSTMPIRPSALVDLPADVDLALALALAKRPDKRPNSASELADALEAALAGSLSAAHRKRARRLLKSQPWLEVS